MLALAKQAKNHVNPGINTDISTEMSIKLSKICLIISEVRETELVTILICYLIDNLSSLMMMKFEHHFILLFTRTCFSHMLSRFLL